MLCKSCGKELPEGAKFCGACGTSTAEETVQQAAEVVDAPVAETATENTPAQENAPKANILDTIKQRLLQVWGIAKPYAQKYKLPLIGGAALVIWLVAIAIVVGVLTAGNGFIATENSILANVMDEEIVVLWNNKVVETGIEAQRLTNQITNLDGTMMAGLTGDGTLFVVRKAKATVVAEDVTYYTVSSNGTGIAYVCEDGDDISLNLYNVKTKKSTTVNDEYSKYAASLFGMALSPDGKTLAYYELNDEGDATLKCFSGKKSIKITSNEVELIGLSNGGKFIYVLGENDDGDDILYSFNKKGQRTKINACSGTRFFFNDDHTQILFTNDGKSFISTNAKSAKKVTSGTARLLLSNDSSSFSQTNTATTYPVENLYKHVYTVSNDGKTGLWLVKKSEKKTVKLEGNVYDCQLDSKAEYVYYTNSDDELCVLKIKNGERAGDKAKTLADDVYTYVVTSDRKKVYFINDDRELYSCNGKNGNGKKLIADEDLGGSLAITAKDVVLYAYDGDLYACSNGRKGKKILSEPLDLQQTANGIIYVADEDSIYVTTGGAKLKKLLDNE